MCNSAGAFQYLSLPVIQADTDVSKILEIMTKNPAAQDAITAIQTPCKPDKVPPFKFLNSQPLEPVS